MQNKKVREFKEKYRRRDHLLKNRFAALGITLEELREFTGVRESTMGSYFSSFSKMPPEIEAKLEKLADELEKGDQ